MRAYGDFDEHVYPPNDDHPKGACAKANGQNFSCVASPFRLTMFADIEAAPRKDWIWEGIFGAGESSVAFGAPGSGKSVLMGHIACHVAWGQPCFGRRVQSGSVLYIAAERAAIVERRMAAFRQMHRVTGALPLGVLKGLFDLVSNPDHAQYIVAHAKELEQKTGLPCRMIVLDTISRALAGGDENSPRDMGTLVGSVGVIQEQTGAHFCGVHHIPTDGKLRLRGHGCLLGAVETTFAVEKTGTTRTATVKKASDGEEGLCFTFDLKSVELSRDENDTITSAPVVVESPNGSETIDPDKKPDRKLTDRQKNALRALTAVTALQGEPPPAAMQLPAKINCVPLKAWREELFARDVLSEDAANPREDFRRLKEALQARGLIGVRDGLVWAL